MVRYENLTSCYKLHYFWRGLPFGCRFISLLVLWSSIYIHTKMATTMSNSSTLLSWLLTLALMILVYTDIIKYNIMEGWPLFFAWMAFISGFVMLSLNIVHHLCLQYNLQFGKFPISLVTTRLSRSKPQDIESQPLSPAQSWHTVETSGGDNKSGTAKEFLP